MKNVNWRRGLLCLWMVAAIAWCAVIVALNWEEMEIATTSRTVHIKFSDTETWDYPVVWGVERIEVDLERRIDALNKNEEEWLAGVPDARKAECNAIPSNTPLPTCASLVWAFARFQTSAGTRKVDRDDANDNALL